jgi:NAD(P)-dependent dehydrogenase (short-subunit alcohol dehydrogenase family)
MKFCRLDLAAKSVGVLRSLEPTPEGHRARIVSLSSTAHMRFAVDFDDLNFEHRAYDPQIAYAQSKTANSLFAVEATRRSASDGIIANAANPGGIATGLQRNFSAKQKASLDAAEAAGLFVYKTIEQGAATSRRSRSRVLYNRRPLPRRLSRKPTPYRTTPTSPTIHTVSNSGHLTPRLPNTSGASQLNSSQAETPGSRTAYPVRLC